MIIVDVVLEGFHSFLKLVKQHNDHAKLLLVSVQRLNYNWDLFNIARLPGSLAGYDL